MGSGAKDKKTSDLDSLKRQVRRMSRELEVMKKKEQHEQAVQTINEINRRLCDEMDAILLKSNRLAVQFLNSQLSTRIAVSNLVIGALHLADNEFKGILGVKDPKPFSMDLLSIFLVALPGLGPVAKCLEVWSKNTGSFKSFMAHLGKEVNDLEGAVFASTAVDADYSTLNQADASNVVIRAALDESYRRLGQAMVTNFFAVPYVINSQISEGKIKSIWTDAALEILDPLAIGLSMTINGVGNLSRIFLYEMLRAYAGRHCKLALGMLIPPNNLPENLGPFGEFRGFSQGSRNEIYKRFGDSWSGTPKYPQIKSYRDIVKHWRVPKVRVHMQGIEVPVH
jgi:hypothetical protein